MTSLMPLSNHKVSSQEMFIIDLKGVDYLKMSSFAHPHLIPNVYDYYSNVEEDNLKNDLSI